MISGAVILTCQRSGSELLRAFLDNHRNILCHSELLEKHSGRGIIDFLEGYFTTKPATPVRVFKIMHNHIYKSGVRNEIMDFLRKNQIKIINLKRKDNLRRATSIWVNYRNNVPGREAVVFETPEVAHIEADIDKLATIIRKEAITEKWCLENQKGIPNINITYEDIVGKEGEEVEMLNEALTKKLCHFLGVRVQPLYVRNRKQNPGNWKKVIINHNELEMKFKEEGLV